MTIKIKSGNTVYKHRVISNLHIKDLKILHTQKYTKL